MLNIANLLKKNEVTKINKEKGGVIYIKKGNTPLNKQWYNSIFAFNETPIRFFPAVYRFTFKLLKSYFNIDTKISKNRQLRRKSKKYKKAPLFIDKFWVSRPEIKHWNKKAIITIHIYNKLYSRIKKGLNKVKFKWGPFFKKKKLSLYSKKRLRESIVLKKEINILKSIYPVYIGASQETVRPFYIKMIKWLKSEQLKKRQYFESQIIKLIDKDKIALLKGLNIIKIQRYNYLKKQFIKELKYIKFKQKILFNEFKFNETFLTPLINILQVIYKKKIEFNIIVLKRHYTNSNILSQMLLSRLEKARIRGKGDDIIDDIIAGYVSPPENKYVLKKKEKSLGLQNIIFNESDINDKYDSLNEFLLTNKESKSWSSQYIDIFATKNIRNRKTTGIYMKVSGRLTKRFKAQRAINFYSHKGVLKDIYTGYKGFSSVLSRGHATITKDKTFLFSRTRIGAFGLRGWVVTG